MKYIRTVSAVLMLLLAVSFPSAEASARGSVDKKNTDIEGFEQKLNEANKYYAEGLRIQESGAKKKLYKKQYKEALDIYSELRKELNDPVDGRIQLSGEISTYISQMYNIDSQFAEDIAAVEVTALPQILYRNAAMTLQDITQGGGLFLPPLVRMPDNRKDYKKALSVPASPGAGNGAPSSVPR
ncbi:MAG: hypothetical protein ABIG11_00525, partial [bacterium]